MGFSVRGFPETTFEKKSLLPLVRLPIDGTLQNRGAMPLDYGPDLKIFDQPERVVDRRMRVARSHGVADAEQLKSSALVVNSRLRAAGDQVGIVDRAEIARGRLEFEIQLVERHGAVVDDDLVHAPLAGRLPP